MQYTNSSSCNVNIPTGLQGCRSYVIFLVRTHLLFRSWVQIGTGLTHFLRWIVYYCVCIQHDIDKSQISFTELCKTLRTNSGLRAINSCLHLFWPQLCKRNICAVFYVYACVWLALISPADCGVLTHPHFYTDLRPCWFAHVQNSSSVP